MNASSAMQHDGCCALSMTIIVACAHMQQGHMHTDGVWPLPRHMHLTAICFSVAVQHMQTQAPVLQGVPCAWWCLDNTGVGWHGPLGRQRLSTKAVQGAALALEGVDHVEGGHGLAAGVLGVGDSVADDVLQEHLQHAAGLLIDEAADALHAAAAGQAPDGGLGDTWRGQAGMACQRRASDACVCLTTMVQQHNTGQVQACRRPGVC